MRALARLAALTLAVLLAAPVALACLEDEAAVTTPSSLAPETPTRAPTRKPTATPAADRTPTPSEGERTKIDQLIQELVALACGLECEEGIGETDPALIQANFTDVVIPPVLPAGTGLRAGFLWPSEAGTGATSVTETTVTLIYVNDDGDSWLELFEGPDIRTAPASGEEIEIAPGVTATISLDDADGTSGFMEWLDAEGILFQLAWEGLDRQDVEEFAAEVATG